MNGEKLRAIREAKGLTRRQVEYATGIARESLASIEYGRTKNPSIATAIKLANFYGVPVEELLGE